MNWQELKQRSLPYIAKITPYIEKSKVYWLKALDFTQKQIQNTPIVLKTLTEYMEVVQSKRLILIWYDEKSPLVPELLLRAPLWSTLAWWDNATIRFYTPQLASELARQLGIDTPVEMRIYFGGVETFHATDIEVIKSWWKDRCYDGLDSSQWKNVQSDSHPEPIDDPLRSTKS